MSATTMTLQYHRPSGELYALRYSAGRLELDERTGIDDWAEAPEIIEVVGPLDLRDIPAALDDLAWSTEDVAWARTQQWGEPIHEGPYIAACDDCGLPCIPDHHGHCPPGSR